MSEKLETAVQAEQEKLNMQEPAEQKKIKWSKVHTLIWIVLGVLCVLLIVSAVVLALRIADYAKVDDRVVSLSSNMDETFDVFAIEYKNDAGEVTISGADGDKVLAPGASVEYTIRLRNTDKVAIDFLLAPQVSFMSDIALPIEVRLIGPDEEYIVGSATEWVDMEQLNGIECAQTLVSGQSIEYFFQWRWPFESGDDAYDTWLGSNVGDSAVGADMAFSVHASANTDAALNGGLFGYQTPDVLYIIIFILLLLVAITLLIIRIIKKLREKAPAPVVLVETVSEAPKLFDWGMTDHMNVIRLDELEAHFEPGEVITLEILRQRGLMNPKSTSLRVLATPGVELHKALTIEADRFSAQAKREITRAGGRAIVVSGKQEKKN